MGLLRKLSGADEEDAPYRCKGCATAFEMRYHVCPECGGYTIERVDWE